MGQQNEEAIEEKQIRAPSKGKASFHRPRWPSLPLRQQTSRRIARPKPGLAMKVVGRDKSLATGDNMIGRRLLMMQGQSTESCNNLLEMAMVKLPPVDIVGIGMYPNPPMDIVGTSMHPNLKDQKQISGEPNTAHAETNTKEVMDNVMMEKEDNGIGLVQEKPKEEGNC